MMMSSALFSIPQALPPAGALADEARHLAELAAQGFHILLILVAVIILVSSFDDLMIDLLYWARAATETVRGVFARPPTLERLLKRTQRRIAVMVPAWREAEVIAGMLVNTLNTFDYDRYSIFVGVYANDPDTLREVERVRARFSNIHVATVPHAGPTSKADCLNWVVQNIFLNERETGELFDIIVMHDAEDVVHPYGLRVVNRFIEGVGMLQLPVLSINRKWNALVACHYMDEFAEFHTKDLPVRTWLTGLTPSAGVATAFSREAMLALCQDHENQPFNTDSLTEDYDIAHRLKSLGIGSRFVRYFARTPGWRRAIFRKGQVRTARRELVATKEFFPDQWGPSIRQKARWMLGISYLGWRQLGWFGSLANRYFLFRDRKALITAPVGALAYLLTAAGLIWFGVMLMLPANLRAELPRIAIEPWLAVILAINLVMLVNRLLHRAIFTWRAHGLRHVWLTPVRIVVSNLISFAAFGRSMRLFVSHLANGKPIAWDKTQHSYPSLAELKHRSTRLGEVLLSWNHVTSEGLSEALRRQKARYRPLGLQLLDLDAVRDEHLAESFAESLGGRADSFDPLAIPTAVLGLLPAALARRHLAIARDVGEGAEVLIAIAEPLSRAAQAEIEAALGDRRARYAFAPRSDIAFALRHAIGDTPAPPAYRDIHALERLGLIDDTGVHRLLREVRRPCALLGDLLVRRGALDHGSLQDAIARAMPNRLGSQLVASGLVGEERLAEALDQQAEGRADALTLAVDLGLLRPKAAADARPRLRQPAHQSASSVLTETNS